MKMAKESCTREEYEQFKAIHRDIIFFCDYQSDISVSKYDCRKIELIEKADYLWPVFKIRCNELSICLDIEECPDWSPSTKKTLDWEMFKRAINTNKNYGWNKVGSYANVNGVEFQTERGWNRTVMPQINKIFYTLQLRLKNKYFHDEKKPKSSPKKPVETAGQIEPEVKGEQSKGNKELDIQKGNGPTGEALALAMLVDHPDWSDTKIAKAIGVNRTTLYDWQNFKKAKEALKQGKNEFPKGSKNGKTGNMQAWEANT
jgi:hypothetical protein